MDDIRVLCYRCADNYRDIGYMLFRRNDFKRECFICGRLGFEYEIRKREKNNGKIICSTILYK